MANTVPPTSSVDQQGERHLQLLVDGLRAKDSTLPHRPLTRAQLDDLLVRE